MSNENEIDIPNLKGKKNEDRKKGAAGTWGSGPGRGVFGLGRLMSGGMGNALLTVAVAVTSLYSLNNLNTAGGPGAGVLRPGKMFSSPVAYDEASTRNLPSDAGGGADGLQFLNSANHGALGQGEKAPGADAAGASGQNQDAASADAQAAEQAAAAAQGQSTGAGGAGRNSPFASRFGQLSSGKSTLSGGSGMAGGVGRGFDSAAFKSKTTTGQLSAMARAGTIATRKTGAVPRAAITLGKNKNFNKLKGMSAAMKPTMRMGNLQQASGIQTEQWSAAATGDTGIGGQPTGGIGADSGGVSLGPEDDGGPVNPTSGNVSTGETTSAPIVGSGKDVSPWSGLVKTAQQLILAAAALMLLAAALSSSWIGKPLAAAIAAIIAGVIAVAVAGIGAYIMAKYGQTGQGLIFVIAGGILAFLGFQAAATGVAGHTTGMIAAGVGGILSSITGALGNKDVSQ